LRVQLDIDESWTLLSVIVKNLMENAKLSEDDRSNLRRWHGDDMRASGDAIRALHQKMNEDLERLQKNKQRSLIQKHDWV
jgi:hypothetical protein